MAFENVIAELEAARLGQGMLRPVRSDYYGNEFAIQNELDAAFAQKQIEEQAKEILADPEKLKYFIESNGGSIDGMSMPDSGRAPLSIGIGKAYDEIKKDTLKDAVLGLLTGGVGGALQGGLKSYLQGTLGVLDKANQSNDPIAMLNQLQGWTPPSAPVVSNQLNYNTRYNASADPRLNPAAVVSGSDSTGISAEEAAGLAAAQSSFGYGSDKDYYGD